MSAVTSNLQSASVSMPGVNEQHVPYKSTAMEEDEMNRNDAANTKEYKLGTLQSQNSPMPTSNNQWVRVVCIMLIFCELVKHAYYSFSALLA